MGGSSYSGRVVPGFTGCKWPVISYTRGPSQGGDSGAPMYLPSGASAFARGTVIAGDGVTSYAEKWSRMAAGFGIAIVTGRASEVEDVVGDHRVGDESEPA